MQGGSLVRNVRLVSGLVLLTFVTCHLVNLAYYHGQSLKWNPKKEQFTGGTGKAGWLNVPHRGPWQVS